MECAAIGPTLRPFDHGERAPELGHLAAAGGSLECHSIGRDRLEVTQGSRHAPAPRTYGPIAGTGRGLTLLEEMADAWGVEPGTPARTVWFTISRGEPARRWRDARPAHQLWSGRALRTTGASGAAESKDSTRGES